jgi:hypothetical protein
VFNCPKYQYYFSETFLGGEGGTKVIEIFLGIRTVTFLILIGVFMEKFTIKVTDKGVVMIGEKGNRMEFSAGEALMLLDILKNEEIELRKMAESASPMSLNLNV